MEAAAAGLEIRMKAAVEADKTAKIGMKEDARESKVKAAATKTADESANYLSSVGILSTSISSSTATYALAGAPTSTSSVLGVPRRIGFTQIITML